MLQIIIIYLAIGLMYAVHETEKDKFTEEDYEQFRDYLLSKLSSNWPDVVLDIIKSKFFKIFIFMRYTLFFPYYIYYFYIK